MSLVSYFIIYLFTFLWLVANPIFEALEFESFSELLHRNVACSPHRCVAFSPPTVGSQNVSLNGVKDSGK